MNSLPISIVGNLTDDPSLRFTPAGVAVARFTVAHNPRRFDKAAQEWRDQEPTFFACSAWRYLAENLSTSLKKGSRVIVIGTLHTRRWESDGRGKTPEGQKIEMLSIDVDAVGPELTFATAVLTKATGSRSGEVPPDDPWATATATRPGPGPVLDAGDDRGTYMDEPPW